MTSCISFRQITESWPITSWFSAWFRPLRPQLSSALAAIPGSLVQSQGSGCGLRLSDVSSPDLLPSPFQAITGPSRPSHPSFSTGARLVHGLVVSGLPPSREAVQSPSALDYPDHGCLQPQLGRFFTPSSSFGSLVSSGLQTPHQHVGTEGSVLSSSGFCGSGFRALRPCQIGQHDCSVLHQSVCHTTDKIFLNTK